MYYKLQENLEFDFKCLKIPLSTTPTFYPEQRKVERSLSFGNYKFRHRKRSIHECPPNLIKAPSTARELILRKCGQTRPLPFEECYPPGILKNCFKIGEGVYGEVFLFRNAESVSTVMKIIPIEGTQMVNKERQKNFEEVISEIIVAMELSNLRNGRRNKTTGFSEVHKIRCVQGPYPDRLLDLWELYDEQYDSQNDSPEVFGPDQLYIILEMTHGGNDMEAFIFENSQQAVSLLKQTACALAVAEAHLQFEHRDLHWGNILISKTTTDHQLSYWINGNEIVLPSCGIESSVIDFSLSRITYKNLYIFNDLSKDPDIFNTVGDYQFDIYRLMQDRIGNQWQHFEPYTNILWLHYVIDKMINSLHYKYVNSTAHQMGIIELYKLQENVLKYDSVKDLVFGEFV